MSDTELDHTERSSEIPRGGSLSLQQDSVTVLPSTVPTEQLPESADLASTFSLFRVRSSGFGAGPAVVLPLRCAH